ncbi:MAG: hypothetical protein IPO92_07300 [Saprospiraceae bacterium]|nr:hypothetical protein [Saprospiraceae bacterium]
MGNSTPILGEGWPMMRDSIAALATGSNKLEITGWFCEDSAPAETDSTGLKRAAETRKLFPEVTDDKIIILSKAVLCDSMHQVRNLNLFRLQRV